VHRARCPALFGVAAAIAFALSSCASDGRYRPIAPGEGPPIPRAIVLRNERAISTMHFPRGVYRLEAEDNHGYYYRAPRRLMKHAFAGFQPYNGGIFMRKKAPRELRGYVVWAGGRTKIGNFPPTKVEFREQ
jgi:hypothetical protein